MRVTKQMLQEENNFLRRRISELEAVIREKDVSLKTYSVLERHMQTMTVSAEKIGDAMAHIISIFLNKAKEIEDAQKRHDAGKTY